MRKIFLTPLLFLVAYFSFVGVAIASNAVVPEDGSMIDYLKPIYDAFTSGAYWPAAMFLVIFIVTALNRYASKIPVVGAKVDAFLDGQYGKPLTVVLLSFAGAVIAALASPGAVMSGAVAWAALKVAATAVGGYELLKQLLVPIIQKLGAKAPAWMKPVFDLILWAFSKKSAVAKAEEAGAKAVAENPAPGAPKSDVTEI